MIGRRRLPPLALASLLVAACGGPPSGSQVAQPGTPAAVGIKPFVSIGTAPPGGAFFIVGGALAQVLDEHLPGETQVTAEATKGTQENIRRLQKGELDFAVANAAISFFAVRGEEDWDKVYDVRVVMTLAPNVALFLTPASSSITSLPDLRGKRVIVGPAGAGFQYFLRPILEAHGLTYDDFTPLNATQAGAVDMLGDGSADVAFVGGAIPTASITQAATAQDIRFLPFDEAAVGQLVDKYPFFDRALIPGGTYRGLDHDFAALNVGSMHLITTSVADEELVYQVTRTIYESRDQVVKMHPAGRAIQPKVVVRDTGTPFHPGAIRYYREIGIWPTEASAN